MAEFPFQLLIKRGPSKNQTESLTCTALLRAIPGRREVYDGVWNGRAVIVKVFSHKLSAKRHLKREWRGLKLLSRRGLSSPEPLFFGEKEDGQLAVVVKRIADSSVVLDVFHETKDKAKKLDLLILVCKDLAKQHRKGVLQKDLHLGNFLLSGDEVFVLDAGQMQFLRSEVGRRKSISQLAMLACCLPASDTESIARLCEEYCNARGWRFKRSDEALFQKQRTAHRKRGVRRQLKKCLRTGKRHVRIKAGRYLAVFDKGFCLGAKPPDFIEQIDGLMDEGQILKNGNTCYVSCVTWNGKDITVKRYNHKGLIHSLRHTIKRSRARRGWLHAHRLSMLNISTPKPLAYIEQRKGVLVWKSYLVTKYVDGRKLYDFLRDGKTSEEERSKLNQQVQELLERIGKHRITHGDLKHSNILITANELTITDLDSMKVCRCKWTFNIRRRKDIESVERILNMLLPADSNSSVAAGPESPIGI